LISTFSIQVNANITNNSVGPVWRACLKQHYLDKYVTLGFVIIKTKYNYATELLSQLICRISWDQNVS